MGITGPNKKKIIDAFSKNGNFIKSKTKIFGNGKTSKIIIDNILNYSKWIYFLYIIAFIISLINSPNNIYIEDTNKVALNIDL